MEISRNAQRKQETEAFRGYAARGMTVSRTEVTDMDTWLSDLAVDHALCVLRAQGKEHMADAVAAIYFVSPTEPLEKSEIERRITNYCMTHYVCQRSVYNWLSNARRLYRAMYHGKE